MQSGTAQSQQGPGSRDRLRPAVAVGGDGSGRSAVQAFRSIQVMFGVDGRFRRNVSS